jgi:hypothetical protein
VELLVAADRRAVSAWLDVYLDIERRSWKAPAHAGIARHRDRVAFFRSLLDARQPVEPNLLFLMRAGLPIAGFLTLRFGDQTYGIEMAFDEADAELAPGNVLMLLTILDAASRGARSVNLLGNFAYHKMRWKAVVTETAAIEVFRHASVAHLKALGGQLKRRLFGAPPSQDEAGHNLTKVAPPDDALRTVDHDASRARAAQALVATLTSGGRIERYAGAALAERIPFSVPGLLMKDQAARAAKGAQGTATQGTKSQTV